MTLQEFELKIRKSLVFDRWFDYIFAFIMGCIGIWCLYKMTFTDWLLGKGQDIKILAFLFSIFVLYISVLGFIRIPKLEEIHQVYWGKNIEENYKKLCIVTEKLGLELIDKKENYCLFYKKHFWTGGKEIHILINNSGIWINLQYFRKSSISYSGYKGLIKLKNNIEKEFEYLK